MQTVNERLARLRAGMQDAGIDYYVIPSGDFHGSEYLSDHFRAMRFISGFTGSAGTVLVGREEALLWTDGRYFIQAEKELSGSEFKLMRMAAAGVPTLEEYLAAHAADGGTIGFDGRITTVQKAESWQKALAGKQVRLFGGRDLIGEIWEERPEQEFHPAFLLPLSACGESAADKLARVREEMKKAGASVHILSSLDDIAWLLNLRGGDVPHNPVVFSFLIITQEEAVLFCRTNVLGEEITAQLAGQGISVRPYEDFWQAAAAQAADAAVLLDPAKTAYCLTASWPETLRQLLQTNPTTLMKCIKNETEQAALRESHRKDGIAMVKWLYWLKHHPAPESLSEIDAADYLEKCRLEQGAFDLSFETIAAMGPNAAMMHYSATPESYSMLKQEGFLLVDSGGQYPDGTTDITRTVAMGPLSEKQRLHYTAVLRSVLRLGAAHFLSGCTCYFLDILARGPVWDLGIDYRCGTGHGVGFVLNVHEGPNGFRWSRPADMTGLVELKPGMVTTDEPGVYLEGEYGIRIENELLCVEGEENEYGKFLGFEHITLCPIDLEPVIPELLAPDEKRALNEYHEMVYERLKDGLEPEEAAWLYQVTRPLV